jgi:hypothetical protein
MLKLKAPARLRIGKNFIMQSCAPRQDEKECMLQWYLNTYHDRDSQKFLRALFDLKSSYY